MRCSLHRLLPVEFGLVFPGYDVERPVVLVFPERVRIDVTKHCLVGGLEDDRRRTAGLFGLAPAGQTETPAIARVEPRKLELGTRRDEVVSPCPAEPEELHGHDGTDLVPAPVPVDAATAAVPEVSGRRLGATGLEFGPEHVPVGGHIRRIGRWDEKGGVALPRCT